MANCHQQFREYNTVIRLTEDRRQTLIRARDTLRSKIKDAYAANGYDLPRNHPIEFHTQGSFVMDTIINPIEEDYDLDEGTYFLGSLSRAQRPVPAAFHKFVVESVRRNSPEIENVIDKISCVRVKYKKGYSVLLRENVRDTINIGFHIDLPIYYSNQIKSPELANTKVGWIVSDPVEFIEWFEKKVNSKFKKEFLYETKLYSNEFDIWRENIGKDDAQLRRIIRYLKAWCDVKAREMPCGIILTILGANNYVYNDRDDLSLRDTLVAIQNSLKKEFVCRRPTTPENEDLFKDITPQGKSYFLNALDSFAKDALLACNNPDQKDACLKWQKHFGIRFSCNSAMPLLDHKVYGAPAIIGDSAKSA